MSYTEDEVKSLMQTEAYSKMEHPEYESINRVVSQAWENLYPDDDRNKRPENYYVWRAKRDDKTRSSHS